MKVPNTQVLSEFEIIVLIVPFLAFFNVQKVPLLGESD